jgi:hypothetical protein
MIKVTKEQPPDVVYVVDAWDDDAQESYVRVFSTAEKAARDLARWQDRRAGHDLYAGVVKRKIL